MTPRPLERIRRVGLVVLLITLGLSALGHSGGWVTLVMAVTSVALGAMAVLDVFRRPPAPLAQLWRRTDRQEPGDHTGDWW